MQRMRFFGMEKPDRRLNVGPRVSDRFCDHAMRAVTPSAEVDKILIDSYGTARGPFGLGIIVSPHSGFSVPSW